VQASRLSSVANQSQSASGLRSVATSNWGSGSSQFGDPQLKLVVQWLAASVASVPCLYYYTCGHHQLLKVTVSQMTSETHGTCLKSNRASEYKQAIPLQLRHCADCRWVPTFHIRCLHLQVRWGQHDPPTCW
jgi:hypothetical protein